MKNLASNSYSTALERLRQYVQIRTEKPIRQLDDTIHSVHMGTGFQGELRLSDLQEVLKRLDGPNYRLPWSPEETARRFHDAYESFAPFFGYVTREDTRQFDPNTPNGKLMIAAIRQVFIEQVQPPATGDRHE